MQVMIVTGLSGAGKSQAMDVLEDQGYYCIDNMPPALIVNFMDLSKTSKDSIDKVAFAVDIRGGDFFDGLLDALSRLEETDCEVKILFMEASNEVLMRRFSETRRVYTKTKLPVTQQDIDAERNLLSDIRKRADFVIDTSNMKTAQFKEELLELLADEYREETFVISIMSFGFKHGIPVNADMVFDMRFIPNPFYVPSLKKLSGNNQKIREYVTKWPQTQRFIKQLDQMVNNMIPCYMREGKWNLNIAFGCTGGHHRSVAMANEFYERFKKQGRQVTLEHRDVKK